LPKGGYVPLIRRLEKAPAERKTRFRRLWLPASMVGCALALAAMGWWWWAQHQTAPIAIAVVPLENLSHDPASDYFADGLTDEIIRNLSIIDGLAPRSRTSSFAFKGKPRNVHDVGKQLDADYVLEGSVLRSGPQLRINVQLIRVRDDLPLWSGKFDRKLTDVFAIQDEIARGIVNTLRLKLGRGRRRYETSGEAYDLYLRARALPFRKNTVPFEEVIAKDPTFAPAYAGLAAAYEFESGTFGGDWDDKLARMRAAAERAIQLDPLLAEAHDALGMAFARDGQWVQSGKSFHRAIELDSNNSTTYVDFAMTLLLPLGRIEDAVRQMRIAEKADPLSPQVHTFSAFVLLSAGRFDEAAGHCPKGADQIECLGRVRLGQGRIDEAVSILAAAPNPRYFGHALGRAGRREEAEKLAATVATNPFQQALIFAGLGDKDRTFEALDRMTVQGPVRIGRALTLPEFALLRGDPRVKALRKKVGLPE
jgi:adenylate cyclase